MKENINALDEIHKGCCMGVDAIHFILEKVEDQELKDLLAAQFNLYDDLKKRVEDIYPAYNDGRPHETSKLTKAMTYSGIEMKTFNDHSNSKLAELLIQGTNMGIIEGRRILNKKEIDQEVHEIIDEYVKLQEEYLDKLKSYL